MEVIGRTRSPAEYSLWLAHQPWEEIEDDQLQMAGDVVFAPDGKILFKHISQHPFDRPCVEAVIQEVKKASSVAGCL